jgi:hypothetical protein
MGAHFGPARLGIMTCYWNIDGSDKCCVNVLFLGD